MCTVESKGVEKHMKWTSQQAWNGQSNEKHWTLTTLPVERWNNENKGNAPPQTDMVNYRIYTRAQNLCTTIPLKNCFGLSWYRPLLRRLSTLCEQEREYLVGWFVFIWIWLLSWYNTTNSYIGFCCSHLCTLLLFITR